MQLTNQQRAALEAKANEIGVDPKELIAEAESLQSESPQPATRPAASPNAGSASSADRPKLFMYLLPFVTVREVRTNWLGLSEVFAGDNEIASAWAAKNGGGQSDPNAGS